MSCRIGRRVEARRRTAPRPPGWGLGGGLITRSQKMLVITETEARTTTAPYRAKGTAQNRVRWRALVEDLCST